MSLQVWLPLNGDAKNYGVANVTTTAASGITYTDGKIGQCANAASSVSITATVPNLSTMLANGKTYSLACWVKVKSVGANGWAIRLGTNSCGLWWGYSTARWVWNENDSGKRSANATISADTEWHHLVTTVDKTVTNQITTKHYVDGIPAADCPGDTWDSSGQAQPADNTITITPYVAMLNDIRLYDEILSPKQIKEISKALVVHYPLNDQYNSSVLNKYSGSLAHGDSSSTDFTKTKLVGENGYNYKGTFTATSSSTWWWINFPNFTFTVGKKYCWSIKARCNKCTPSNMYMCMRAARVNNDYADSNLSKTIGSPTLVDGQWHEYYLIQTIPSTVVKNGSTVNCNPRLECYTAEMKTSGTVYELDIDIKDVQVVESDCYVPFIKNEFASDTVFDTSGFRNNGTINGALTVLSDNSSPRYSCDIHLANSNNIEFKEPQNMYHATYTFWVKFDSLDTQYTSIHMGKDYPNATDMAWFAVNTESAKLWAYFRNNSPQYVKAGSDTLSINTWYFLAFRWNNGVAQWFLNGEAVDSAVTFTTYTYITNHRNITLGNSFTGSQWYGTPFNGCISDYRLYATALSNTDIKELYQTSASFDNLGNVHAYEIVEDL